MSPLDCTVRMVYTCKIPEQPVCGRTHGVMASTRRSFLATVGALLAAGAVHTPAHAEMLDSFTAGGYRIRWCGLAHLPEPAAADGAVDCDA